MASFLINWINYQDGYCTGIGIIPNFAYKCPLKKSADKKEKIHTIILQAQAAECSVQAKTLIYTYICRTALETGFYRCEFVQSKRKQKRQNFTPKFS